MFVHRMSYDSNPKVGNITASYVNNAINDAVMNMTFDVFETILSMKLYLRVRLPEDKSDRRFQKDLLKTSIDDGKMLSGIAANFLIKSMLDNLLKSFDFDPKLPFPPVNIAS